MVVEDIHCSSYMPTSSPESTNPGLATEILQQRELRRTFIQREPRCHHDQEDESLRSVGCSKFITITHKFNYSSQRFNENKALWEGQTQASFSVAARFDPAS